MRSTVLSLLLLVPALVFGQSYKRYERKTDRLSIGLTEGILDLIPLSERVVRVRWIKAGVGEEREFVFERKTATPKFKHLETPSQLRLQMPMLTVVFNKSTGSLDFLNKEGKIFLSEKAGSRKLSPDKINGEACYVAEQSFSSPEDEHLLGLGQFQDGNFNLRNVSRKLTQVNSQIAIPFLYSSRNYGILWHQYGLTYFNPADQEVSLVKDERAAGSMGDVEVTTTSGTQRVLQQQSVYNGKFSLDRDGEYSIMLDLGNMDNRHLVIIDGVAQIDQSNLWLPPSAGKLVHLKAGEHIVQIVCKATNTPKFSWKQAEDVTTFRSPHARSLDYVVFSGNDADEIIGSYRELTGPVPMLPLWAFGYWQCRERYTSGTHLVETVKEFRKRNLPMDVIVQDWQYWGKYGWGVPKFDETHYPEPEKFIKELHNLNARFSISVWENIDKKSEIAQEYIQKNLYIPNSPWIDIYNPEAQKTHWDVLNKNLFSLGVDSWWMDATEPENDALAGKTTHFGSGDFYRLTYPLFVSKAVYEGQRKTDPGKRVAILTRSAFSGQQRYGTINWSGDIGWNWDTFKRQIVAGLNFNMTGMPYWTTDIGGFFRPGQAQYTDEKYHDILVRWFQWGAFNPIFRMHGYQSETEPWKYGEKVENAMRKMMNLRYRLMPYTYSAAWQVSKNGSTIMRPLVMDFQNDPKAVEQGYEYMFGKSMLIAPVTEAGMREWDVYLPKASGWYDLWTGKSFSGGQVVKADASGDKIPVFVKGGSIIPFGRVMQHTAEHAADSLEIRVYEGADGSFQLYEDEGDNYNYEKGEYTLIPFKWKQATRTLEIGALQGAYVNCLKDRVFRVVLVKEGIGIDTTGNPIATTIAYKGKGISIKLSL